MHASERGAECLVRGCSVHIDRRKNDTGARATTQRSAALKTRSSTFCLSCGLGCASPGWGCTGLSQSSSSGCALRALPSALPADEMRAGRRHGSHEPPVLPTAGERLDPLGRCTGGRRLRVLLQYLGQQGGHLRCNRSAHRRDDSLPAERPRPGSSGPRVHAPLVAGAVLRNLRGLRPLTSSLVNCSPHIAFGAGRHLSQAPSGGRRPLRGFGGHFDL